MKLSRSRILRLLLMHIRRCFYNLPFFPFSLLYERHISKYLKLADTIHNNVTQASDFDSTNAVFLSNRSVCWIRLGQAEHALEDARAARALNPEWSKPCYREGAALRLLQVCPLDSLMAPGFLYFILRRV